MSDAAVVWVLVLLAAIAFAAGYWVRAALGRSGSSKRADRDDRAVPDEIIAVIAAAVAEVIDGPHRIVRIRGLTPDDLGWMLEGRMQHHASHKPRH